jgi:hypothetical protein
MRFHQIEEAPQIKTDDNMRTYMALKGIEKKMHAQGIKGAQALEFLQTTLLDIALNAVGREKRAGYEPHVLNVKNWADAKEFLMTAFRDGREQGVAEGYYDLNDDGMQPIDLSSNPSFKQIINRYTQLVYQGHAGETNPEEDEEYDAIEQYVAKRFGPKGSAHLQKAGEVSYWGRDDKPFGRDSRSSNLGRPSQPGGDFRTTKAGKMHGQDAKVMKAKVADRLGRHPAPNLPEGVAEGTGVTDYNPPSQGGTRKELTARYHKTKDPKDAEAARKAGATQKELQGVAEGYTVTRGIDRERYQERPGLEGPFSTRSGKVVYYDPQEGKYYDPETDFYIGHEDWNAMNEAGFGRATGRASWDSNMPDYQGDYGGEANWGRREREDDEHHEIDRRNERIAASGTWYITIDGKLLKNKEGQPYTFVGKAAANKAAVTMMQKPFNQGKKFMLTTKGE